MATKKSTKLTAWSYSRLSLYEQCPRKYKYRHMDKLYEPKNDAMMKGIETHQDAAKFLEGKLDYFPASCENFMDQFYELRDLNPIVEQQWAFKINWRSTHWFDKNTRVRVIVDASVIYDDKTADIIDHKTGKRYDDDYRPQMGLFAGAMFKKFPELKHITTRMWYLDTGDEVIEEFSRAEALAVLAELEEKAELMLNAERFPPQQSWKCRFCHFRRNNGGPCEF